MKNNINLIRLLTGILILVNACSSPQPKFPLDDNASIRQTSEEGILKGSDQSTSVTLDYELGKDHYLFQVISNKDTASVNSYLDKHLLKQGTISRDKYLGYLHKVQLFLSMPEDPSAKIRPCRGPFKVTLKSPDSTKISMGCRNQGDGTLSRLVREGEFLLYSGN